MSHASRLHELLIVHCLTLALVIHSSIPVLWPLLGAYIAWVFLIDQAPVKGGRASQKIRKSRFWVWFANYYPVRCVF